MKSQEVRVNSSRALSRKEHSEWKALLHWDSNKKNKQVFRKFTAWTGIKTPREGKPAI